MGTDDRSFRGSGEIRPTASLAAVVALGLVVRGVLLAATYDRELWADEAEYAFLGLLWDRFGFYVPSADWFWPPGYPWLLARAQAWFQDQGILAVQLLQLAASGVIGTSIVLLARRLFSRRAAFLAGLAWALHLPLAGYAASLWPETLTLALLMPAMVLVQRVLAEPRECGGALRLLGCGVLLGTGILFKQSLVPLPALLAGGILLSPRMGGLPLRASRAGILLLSAALVVVPWAQRNQSVLGHPVWSGSTLGENAFLGVNASQYSNFDYVGLSREELYGEGSRVDRWFIQPPAAAEPWARSSAASHVERSREDGRQAARFAREHPGYFLRTRVKKLADWVTPISFFVRHYRLGLFTGWLDQPSVRRVLVVLAVLTTLAMLAGALPGLVLTPASSPRWPLTLVLLCMLAPSLLVSMSRFRVPAEPLMLVLAAGFVAGPSRGASRRRRRLALAGSLVLLGLWTLNAPEVAYLLRRTW